MRLLQTSEDLTDPAESRLGTTRLFDQIRTLSYSTSAALTRTRSSSSRASVSVENDPKTEVRQSWIDATNLCLSRSTTHEVEEALGKAVMKRRRRKLQRTGAKKRSSFFLGPLQRTYDGSSYMHGVTTGGKTGGISGPTLRLLRTQNKTLYSRWQSLPSAAPRICFGVHADSKRKGDAAFEVIDLTNARGTASIRSATSSLRPSYEGAAGSSRRLKRSSGV